MCIRDSYCETTLIQNLYDAIQDRAYVLAFSQSRYIDEDGNDLGSALLYTDSVWPGDFSCSFGSDGVVFRDKYMGLLNAIPNASAVLFRKEAYVKAGFANESMHFAGDWDIWIRLMSFGSVRYVSDELNKFRCHSSTSRAKGRTAKSTAEVLSCRVLVYMNMKEPVGACLTPEAIALGLQDGSSRVQLINIIKTLDWKIFSSAVKEYHGLERVTAVSASVWSLFRIYCLLEFSRRSLFSWMGRAKRLFQGSF